MLFSWRSDSINGDYRKESYNLIKSNLPASDYVRLKTLICAKKMVLATCKDNRVTARNMSVILLDEDFYFQTDKTFLKYEQITDNPYVALCIDNIQLEGMATVLGHPLADNNSAFAIGFEKNYKGSFDAYSSL